MPKTKAFVLYTDQYPPISGMTPEQKGMLLDAIFSYHREEAYTITNPEVKIAFGFFEVDFKRDAVDDSDVLREWT